MSAHSRFEAPQALRPLQSTTSTQCRSEELTAAPKHSEAPTATQSYSSRPKLPKVTQGNRNKEETLLDADANQCSRGI
jgi:hypothetical protein